MDRIKSRNADGTQNKEYYRQYYLKNKNKLSALNKERLDKYKSTEKGLKLHRDRSRKATKKYRLSHPDKIKPQRKLAYRNRKIKAMILLGGAICRNCGCNELDFLEFNHINGNGCKEHRESACKPMADRILSKNRDTSDLEILCRVCNALDYLRRKDEIKAKGFKITWVL